MLRSDHGAVNSSGKRLDMPSVFLQLLIAVSVNSVFTDSLKLLNIKGHVILIVKTGIFFYFCWAHPPPSPLSLSILLSRCQHVKIKADVGASCPPMIQMLNFARMEKASEANT